MTKLTAWDIMRSTAYAVAPTEAARAEADVVLQGMRHQQAVLASGPVVLQGMRHQQASNVPQAFPGATQASASSWLTANIELEAGKAIGMQGGRVVLRGGKYVCEYEQPVYPQHAHTGYIAAMEERAKRVDAPQDITDDPVNRVRCAAADIAKGLVPKVERDALRAALDKADAPLTGRAAHDAAVLRCIK